MTDHNRGVPTVTIATGAGMTVAQMRTTYGPHMTVEEHDALFFSDILADLDAMSDTPETEPAPVAETPEPDNTPPAEDAPPEALKNGALAIWKEAPPPVVGDEDEGAKRDGLV
jgi:hypothetical protein